MTRVSDPMFNGDIVRRVKELEAKVRELSAGRRLEAATVGAGGITVKGGNIRIMDADGTTLLAQIGKLPGGASFGVAALDPATGNMVTLDALAYGLRTDTVLALETVSSTSYGDMTTPGPEVTCEITSGRAVVILSAALGSDAAANSGANMAVEISGATTIAAPAADASLILVKGGTISVAATASIVVPVTGLNNGEHTFTAKYRSGFGNAVPIGPYRNITVLPY